MSPWHGDWAWGLPLIALTVVIHAVGLLFIRETVDRVQNWVAERCGYRLMFVAITGTTAMIAALLHGIEGIIWAAAYLLVGAVPDYAEAVLYSLNAMTSYGHESLALAQRWQVLGALEALNGVLLFGLTTAFLFGVIQRAEAQRQRTRSAATPSGSRQNLKAAQSLSLMD